MLYLDIDRELVQLDETIARLRARLSAPAVQRITNMPKSVPAHPDAMAETITKVCELQKKYNEQWDLLIDLQRKIEASIEGLAPMERLVMRKRYLEGQSWNRIIKDVPCSEQTIYRIHRRALSCITGKSDEAQRKVDSL